MEAGDAIVCTGYLAPGVEVELLGARTGALERPGAYTVTVGRDGYRA